MNRGYEAVLGATWLAVFSHNTFLLPLLHFGKNFRCQSCAVPSIAAKHHTDIMLGIEQENRRVTKER